MRPIRQWSGASRAPPSPYDRHSQKDESTTRRLPSTIVQCPPDIEVSSRANLPPHRLGRLQLHLQRNPCAYRQGPIALQSEGQLDGERSTDRKNHRRMSRLERWCLCLVQLACRMECEMCASLNINQFAAKNTAFALCSDAKGRVYQVRRECK